MTAGEGGGELLAWIVRTGGPCGARPRGEPRAETLRPWVRQADPKPGERAGCFRGLRTGTAVERERIRASEREVRELRQTDDIQRKASACFAQAELDRRSEP